MLVEAALVALTSSTPTTLLQWSVIGAAEQVRKSFCF
jgi:hypothetical protein